MYVGYNVVTMPKVNIRELKAHLSELIDRVVAGETIVVAKRNEPVAELRPIARRSGARILGKPVKGLHVPAAFFDPLPDDVISMFDGQAAP
jgi:prevent-host-death family protein